MQCFHGCQSFRLPLTLSAGHMAAFESLAGGLLWCCWITLRTYALIRVMAPVLFLKAATDLKQLQRFTAGV